MLNLMHALAKIPRRWYWAAASLLILLLLCFYLSLNLDLRQVQASKLLLDRHDDYLGEVMGQDDQRGFWPLEKKLPQRIVVATLETEDRYFWQHPGLYLPSLLRAIKQNFAALRVVSGASTIAMQLARLQHPPSRRGLFIKIHEAAEAIGLVWRHGHDAVLRQYLLLAPYGNRVRGAVYAARYYFNKPLKDLSWLQAAYLAALPQAPGRMNPFKPSGRIRGMKRARRILKILHSRGRIDDETLRQALASDLYLRRRPRRDPASMHIVLELSRKAKNKDALILRASLDLDLQRQVRRELASGMHKLRARNIHNGAALVVDHRSGEVLAALGSPDYFAEDARGAIDFLQVKRSPGSALKPFSYGLALDSGNYTAASEFQDTMMSIVTENGRSYQPRNIGERYYGPLLLRQALANSRNIPALRLLSEIGLGPVLRLFKNAGVSKVNMTPGAYGLGLALGNLPVSPIEIATLYTAIAADGHVSSLRYFLDDPQRVESQLFSPQTASMLRNILADDSARIPAFRIGNPLEFRDFAVAAKTGTSQGYRDAWSVMISDRLIVVVWLGNHDWSKSHHVGGIHAAEIAHQVMLHAMSHVDPQIPALLSFAPPRGWIQREICPISGKIASAYCPRHRSEFFRPGHEPVQSCTYHRSVKIDLRNQLRAGPDCPKKFVRDRSGLDLPQKYRAWARQQHLELLPAHFSPLCAPQQEQGFSIHITSPKNHARFLWDPDTPIELSKLRLSANVKPWNEDIVWIVDGKNLQTVSFPHDAWLALTPGRHVIRAAFSHRPEHSRDIVIYVLN